jgi:hypothetical protein
LIEDFCGFPQSLQSNVGTAQQIMPQPPPSKSFPIHYLLTILLFDIKHAELLKVSLNKPQINKTLDNMTSGFWRYTQLHKE